MRRTAFFAALTAVSSIALVTPSAADAAATATRLVGTASCVGGGQIRLATSIDEARTAKAVVKVSGATRNRWVGELIAGIDANTDTSMSGVMAATKKYVAKHGTFSATAIHANASSANALGVFMSMGLRSTCTEMVLQAGTQYLVADAQMRNGLAIGAGRLAAVDASINAERGHRYRATFTVAGRSTAQHFTSDKTAKKRGVIDIVVRHVKRLSRFSKVSVRVADLTDRSTPRRSYSIIR